MNRLDVGLDLITTLLEERGDRPVAPTQGQVGELSQERAPLFERSEELQTINEELRERSDDLNRASGFLESILTDVRSGVVVLDGEFRVIAWNYRAEDLWGLRADEVKGQNFLNLDIGLPTGELRTPIRACLAGDRDHYEVVVPATNRRGKAIVCTVMVTPLGGGQDVSGAILMMDEQPAIKTIE